MVRALLAMLLLLFACGRPSGALTEPPVATARNPDVILVTLDTTRADRLGAYGYAAAQTPTIDRLAAGGVRYARAYSTLPLTIPSHSAMFTGKWPFHLNIRENGDNLLADGFTTLAEHFSAAGYDTVASVAAFVTTRRWGFSQGFEVFFDQMPEGGSRNYWHTERGGDLVVDDALKVINDHPTGTPLFAWVHLYDAHNPYQSHPGQAAELAARPYDAELAFVDAQIERLVSATSGRDVIFVLVGDHGEALGEHDEATHGLFTYDATQHVPWIISGAGIKPGVVEAPVSTVGLAATVAHAAGLPPMEGVDVGPQPAADSAIYAESYQLVGRFGIAPHRAVVEGNWKLIATPEPELYDLLADPAERNNVAGQHPDEVKKLQARLEALGASPPTGASQLDAETISQLAALGYVSSGPSSGVDPLSLPDPKRYTELLKLLLSVDARPPSGPDEALELFQRAVAMKPDALEPRMRQLPVLSRLGRQEEARALMEETAALFPDSARVWVSLSGMALSERDAVGGLEYARKAISAQPTDPGAQEQVVTALLASGQVEQALTEGEVFFGQNPKNHGLAAVLGRAYLSARRFDEAVQRLAVAVEAPNPRHGVRTQLAWLMIAAKHPELAMPLLDAELDDYPRYPNAHRLLAEIYGRDRLWAQQLPHLEELARQRRHDFRAQLQLAQCQFNLKEYVLARRSLDEAMALAADDPDVLLLHANLLAKEGRREEGMEVFKRADALNTERVTRSGLPVVPTQPAPDDLPGPLPEAGATP